MTAVADGATVVDVSFTAATLVSTTGTIVAGEVVATVEVEIV